MVGVVVVGWGGLGVVSKDWSVGEGVLLFGLSGSS